MARDSAQGDAGAWATLKMRVAEALIPEKGQSGHWARPGPHAGHWGCPISAEMLKFFTGLDMVIREVYGQSESCGATTLSVPGATKLGSVGRPVDGAEVRIADDGEIFVRGPHVFRGYAGNPAGTAEALVEGWLASGDLGHMDEESYLIITGRKKDLLITSGGKTSRQPTSRLI